MLIFLGYRHHQAQIGLDYVVLGLATVAQGDLQLFGIELGMAGPGQVARIDALLQFLLAQIRCPGPLLFGRPVAVLIGFPPLEFFESMQFGDGRVTTGQLPLLLQEGFPSLDETGQGDLLLIGEQVDPADVLEIKPQQIRCCLLYTSPSPRDRQKSRMPSSA